MKKSSAIQSTAISSLKGGQNPPMPSNIWTHLTKKQGGFFAGALPLSYTRDWGLLGCANLSFHCSNLDATSIGWTESVWEGFGTHVFTFRAQETQDAPQPIPPEFVARLYCHAVISAAPYEALPDLVETLRDLESQFLKPAAQVTQPSNPTSKFSAKVGTPIARPEFNVDGE
jgi:hypothetical protein